MTSKLTRERIELIANFHRVMALPTSHAEIEELARMALAAMEGESHTDDELSNLLWYSQEATCHSDPNYSCEFQRLATPGLVAGIILELQERRKAAMDGEPVAEVLSNRPGNDTSTIDRALPVGTQLYRHAQPALVVPDEIKHRIGGLDWGWEGEFNRGWNACRAAMLQAEPVCTCPSGDGSLRRPCPVHPGSSPVIPDGYVMVPMRLTAENGAKGALSGEFSETKFVNCPECFGDDECETCDGSGRIEITVPVTWTTIKEIWAKGIEHFAAAPQSPGGDHATVPGKWIPVSERLPEDSGRYWCYVEEQNDLGKSHYQWNCSWNGDRWWVESEGGGIVTHWMPLPAAPQEVNRE
ncbi:Eaa1 [Klebsiella pneumoniae]|nr:Eaa1 [Klebsiella pneumoniae]